MRVLQRDIAMLCLLVGLGVAAAAQCQRDIDYTKIQSQVYDRADPSLVIFYETNKPGMDDFSSKMESHGICVGFLDCKVSKSNAKVCQQARIQTIPAAALYVDVPKMNPYTKKNFREPVVMTEAFEERSIEKFVGKTLPHNIKVLKTLETAGVSSSQPAVLLFTQKSTVSTFYRTISFFFRDSLGFYLVKASDDDDLSEYGVSELPTLVVRLTSGDHIPYTGDLKSHGEIIEWLAQYGAKIGADLKTESVPETTKEPEALTPTQFNNLFSSTSEEAAYVIALVGETAAVPTWWPTLTSKCFGSVKSVIFRCGKELSDTANQFCSSVTESQSSVVAVLPFSQSSKKKVLSNPSKWLTFPDSDGKVDLDSVVKKAQDSIPENSVSVLMEHEVDTLLSAAQTSGTVAIVALSNKQTPSALIRNIALTVKGKVQIAFVGQPSTQFLERFGSPAIPSVIGFLPPGGNGRDFQLMLYDPSVLGPLTYPSVLGFINAVARARSESSSEGESTSSSTSPQSDVRKGPAVVKHVKTTQEWESLCGSQFKGICAVAFMGSPEGMDTADTASVALFQQAVEKVSSSSVYNFLWIDASCQVKLAELFEVTGGSTPALAVYSPLKNRYAKFVGRFDQNLLTAYIEGMAGGRVPTFPLTSKPAFEEKDCTIPLESQGAEEFEADDFLAEIQREEEEKAEAIKKALEEEKKQRELKEKEEANKKKKKKTKSKKSKSEL